MPSLVSTCGNTFDDRDVILYLINLPESIYRGFKYDGLDTNITKSNARRYLTSLIILKKMVRGDSKVFAEVSSSQEQSQNSPGEI